jgi:HEAT repeat protein
VAALAVLLLFAAPLAPTGTPTAEAVPRGKKKKKKKKKKRKPPKGLAKATSEELKEIRWYVGKLGARHPFLHGKACKKLSEYGHKAEMAIQPLSHLMHSAKVEIAVDCASALAHVGRYSTVAVKALGKAVREHKEAGVRREAAFGLGIVGEWGADAVDDLIKGLADESADVREASAMALGTIGAECLDAGPELEKLLADDDARVAMAAAIALPKVGHASDAAVPLLTKALGDKRQVARRTRAAEALGALGESAAPAVSALSALVAEEYEHNPAIPYGAHRKKQHFDMRVAAANALGAIGAAAKDAVGALTTVVDEESNEGLKQAAEAALKAIGS